MREYIYVYMHRMYVPLHASKRAMLCNFIVMPNDDDNDDEPVFSGINVSSSSSRSSSRGSPAVNRSCSLTTRIVGYWHHLLYPAPTDEQAPQPNSSSPAPHLPLQTSQQVHSN